jgi:hypothetical protein
MQSVTSTEELEETYLIEMICFLIASSRTMACIVLKGGGRLVFTSLPSTQKKKEVP